MVPGGGGAGVLHARRPSQATGPCKSCQSRFLAKAWPEPDFR
jgi:hypothetical protein